MSTQAVATRREEDQAAQHWRAGTATGDDNLRRRLLEVLLTPVERTRMMRPKMTYEEFLAWANEDTLAEWVDGEVVMYSPASKQHQDMTSFLYEMIRAYTRPRDMGEIVQAPFQMKLEHGREPDLLFVAREHLNRLRKTYLDGPADLVVEIISPESLDRDRGAKFAEYEAGGIPEYWLLDPVRRWAEFYRLGEDGRYRTAFAGAEGVYQTEALPGFWLRVEWLWQEPLPHPLRALGEIVGLAPEVVEQFLQALGGGAERV